MIPPAWWSGVEYGDGNGPAVRRAVVVAILFVMALATFSCRHRAREPYEDGYGTIKVDAR
jgi:hypothetical protein